jgi:flavorubredoxin
MTQTFKATKIADGVYWVGAIDWSLRNFHGYTTHRGTTYNAYLIMADKITLIDTVKRPFFDEMISRVASVVDPGDIAYIVSNHAEMDHSGSLPETIAAVNPEKVFASEAGVSALSEHFDLDFPVTGVADGEELSLGDRSLSFVEAKMLHWPESMMTVLSEQGLLFSQDVFGMHLATSERFVDQIAWDVIEREAATYFANIVMPFAPMAKRLLDRLSSTLDGVRVIAPDHGPVWREEPGRVVGLYKKWCDFAPSRKAVIVYDTMWGSTEKMARAVSEGLIEGDASATLMPLSGSHRSDVATELLDAGALIVGSPTLNGNMFPTIADILSYLQGLKRRNLVGAAFGSYGWNPTAIKQIEDALGTLKVELSADPVKVRFVPNEDDLTRCRQLGRDVAEKLAQICDKP